MAFLLLFNVKKPKNVNIISPLSPPARKAALFIVKMLALYVAWYVTYQFWLQPNGQFDHLLTHQVGEGSTWLMQVLGYEKAFLYKNFLYVGQLCLVAIGDACNGSTLYALFASFILAAPGHWRAKLFYLPAGIAAIYALNLVRVCLLAINAMVSRETFHFNHHYTFVFVVYGFIFLLWVFWINRFSGLVTKTA
jgi:exosortase family protein XrtF